MNSQTATAPDAPVVLGDDPEVVAFVYRRYRPYVSRIAGRLMMGDDDIPDLVQDVFLAALSGRREVQNIRAWLAEITVRKATDRLRRRKVRGWFQPGRTEVDSLAAHDLSPSDREALRVLQTILGRVPVKQRIAWTLRHIEEMELQEVASACSCSLATAKRWIAAVQLKVEAIREA